VIDASAALELLLQGSSSDALAIRAFTDDQSLHAPHLIDLEVLQVLRRHVFAGHMTGDHGAALLETWRTFPVHRHSHELLARRIWDLRTSLTAYDAAYVALSELMNAPLITTDTKLARAHGHRARIEVF
jgi:predicted nucleic acid-binding protein